MSDNKDKGKQDKAFQKKSRVKSRYNTPDDDSDREVYNEDARVNKHTDIPDQFKQYIDEMHEYYQQQQAYLQEQNARCFQKLFQIVCQGQQRQTTMAQSPWSYLHPYCLPQDRQPNGSSYPRHYPPPTVYNNSPPGRQDPPQGYVPRPPQEYAPPPLQGYARPPPPSDDVLYENVVNGTRVTVRESPRSGHSPHADPPSTSHHGQPPAFNAHEDRQNHRCRGSTSSSSLARESTPQVTNLFITVAPHVQPPTDYPPPPQQPPPSSHAPQGLRKKEPSKYDLDEVEGDGKDDVYVMPRRRSVRDALRERMKNRDRYRARNWLDREGE